MLKLSVTVKATGLSKLKPEVLNTAFTKKTMPKLYRFIEVATKANLKDKNNLPYSEWKICFFDDERKLTGKKGPHLVNRYHTRTEDNTLFISNSKTVKGGWNVFWMLNEGTRDYTIAAPKFMRFYDRYAGHFKKTRTRAGNYGFTSRFNKHLEDCAQMGVDEGVELWEVTGAMESEFGKLLKKAGLSVEL
jgi:hypothetical protein